YFDSPLNDVEDGPQNKDDDKDKSEDDSSPKEVNTAGQHVNTASLEVNTGRLELNNVDPSLNTASSSDPHSPTDIFKLGASDPLEATHIEFFNDRDAQEVDLGNIPTSYGVPTISHTRIHKDHPIKNVIGEVQSSVQTRRLTKPTSKKGFGKPQNDDKRFIDSGCSRHMTGNMAYLSDFKEFDRGYVTFEGGAHGGKISGKDASYFDSPLNDVEDGPQNKDDDKDKSEDDSSPKEVNTAGQHVNTASLEVNTGRLELNNYHTLFMDGATMEINMLVEKKYPLIKKLLEKMMNLQLEVEEESYPVSLNLLVSLILVSLQKEYDSFMQNYNMHGMRKTINELHTTLKLHEQTLPKKDAHALYVIRAGNVQKKNNKNKKPQLAIKGKNQGNMKSKISYAPKPKIPPPPKRENLAKDSVFH
nr:zinc finger, CCHC-type [Tanacetum cinerariifolium]